MGEVEAFWAGAAQVADKVDLMALADRAGGWEALQRADVAALTRLGVPSATGRAWRAAAPLRSRGHVLTLADPAFPSRLRRMDHPPAVLFVEGSVPRLSEPAIAVVGTRRCTAYGRGVARHLGHAAAEHGLVVVSGLARGVDAAAHAGALLDGRTVAVLGHGLAHTAPASNRLLRDRIVEAGGAIVSTWPDAHPPAKWTFPIRNRWIAGLAEVTVVVEAGLRSGALITAREALAAGRDVAAVPGPVGAPQSAGPLRLLDEGAQVVIDPGAFVAARTQGRAWVYDDWLSEVFAGASVDDVARRHGRSAAHVLAELARLEVAGHVVRLAGQRYAPARRSGPWRSA